MLSLASLAHRVLCTETLIEEHQSRVPGAVWLLLTLQLGDHVQKLWTGFIHDGDGGPWAEMLHPLLCLAQSHPTFLSRELHSLPLPHCQDPYEATLLTRCSRGQACISPFFDQRVQLCFEPNSASFYWLRWHAAGGSNSKASINPFILPSKQL